MHDPKKINIAVDAMGGDNGVTTIVEACKLALDNPSNQGLPLTLTLVGHPEKIAEALIKHSLAEHSQIKIQAAAEVIDNTDLPATVLRRKLDSSMRVAINLVAENKADACISAGNTGALMALSRLILKTLPGIDRPAICTVVPNVHGHVYWLDLGANIDSNEKQLLQFALMGNALCNISDGIEKPKVGLLNVGSEEIKGSDVIKQTAKLLEESELNYIGFVEGNDIYCGKEVDVIVCDGFAGNIALKTGEGLAKFIEQLIKEKLKSSIYIRLIALLAKSSLKSLASKLDPRRYNGASLLGLNGIVVKSHGGTDAKGFANAINIAILEAQNNLPQKIKQQLLSQSDKVNKVY